MPRTQQKPAPPDPARMVRVIKTRGPAPVHLWDPPFCGDMDLIIRRDGTWIHEGRPIRRKAMRQLFASILKLEAGEYFLVNPIEKVRIQVEDCPFIITRMETTGSGKTQEITLITDMDEQVTVDATHPIQVQHNPKTGEPHPTAEVRNGLKALISRNTYYQLIELAQEKPAGSKQALGIYSKGHFFELGRY